MCAEVKETRTPVEGAACPLKGDSSDVPFIDDGDGRTGKDFPKAGEGGDKSWMMLDG